jgi:DNA-directed RNA polymerase subunit RPC12/RpoP
LTLKTLAYLSIFIISPDLSFDFYYFPSMYTKEYQCPACGGAVRLDIASQKLRCFFCAVEYEAEALEEYGKDVAPAPAGDDALFDIAADAAAPASGEKRFDAEIFDNAAPAGDNGALFDTGVNQDVNPDIDATATATVSAAGEDLFDVAATAPRKRKRRGPVFTGNVWENPEADGVVTGGCPSCGAEFFGGKAALAVTCPCCGNAGVVEKRLPGLLKPDRVIPFKYDKSDAAAAFAEFCKGKPLLPGSFRPGDYADGFQSVFVPFWFFDVLAEGDVWYDTVTHVGRGEDRRSEHHPVRRGCVAAFEKIPVDGSEKMDDARMDALEPFDFNEMEKFDPLNFAGGGHAAVACDVDASACLPRVEKRMADTFAEALEESVDGYDEVDLNTSKAVIKSGGAAYSLFPVWTLNAEHNWEDYPFMMNGQTGKLVGKLPVDGGKVWMYRALLTAVFIPVIAALLFHTNKTVKISICIFLVTAWCVYVAGLTVVSRMPKKIFAIPLSSVLFLLFLGSLIAIVFIVFTIIVGKLPGIIMTSVVTAALTGFGIVGKWKTQMNTVKPDAGAYNYMVPGSFEVKYPDPKYL